MMTMTIRYSAGRTFGVLLAALVVGGCATKGDLRDVQTEIRALSARQDSIMVELRRQEATTRDTLRQTLGAVWRPVLLLWIMMVTRALVNWYYGGRSV